MVATNSKEVNMVGEERGREGDVKGAKLEQGDKSC